MIKSLKQEIDRLLSLGYSQNDFQKAIRDLNYSNQNLPTRPVEYRYVFTLIIQVSNSGNKAEHTTAFCAVDEKAVALKIADFLNAVYWKLVDLKLVSKKKI